MKKEYYGKWMVVGDNKDDGTGGSGMTKHVSFGEKSAILKKLTSSKKDRQKRFDIEIDALLKLKGTFGVIPILDSYKNETSLDYFWYVMEEGVSSKKQLSLKYTKMINLPEEYFKFIIKEAIRLFITLKKIHDKGYFHRDIKPENLVWYGNRFVFIDFGIAKDNFDENPDNLTQKYDSKQLGAKFYMAPEMRRNPVGADLGKADIYSLTKTIWAMLTQNYLSFDGQYSHITTSFLSFYSKFNYSITQGYPTHLMDNLHNLFIKNTSNNPNERLSIEETINQLKLFYISYFFTNKIRFLHGVTTTNLIYEYYFLRDKLFNNFHKGNITNKDLNINLIQLLSFIIGYSQIIFKGETLKFNKILFDNNSITLDGVRYSIIKVTINFSFNGDFNDKIKVNFYLEGKINLNIDFNINYIWPNFH